MGLSKQELLAINDDIEFVGRVIDHIWALPWPNNPRSAEYVQFFKSLPKEQRVIWSTWRVQAEIQNGGFGGYFANLEDDCFVAEALNGFRILGAHEMLAMFESLLDYFDVHKSEIRRAKDWHEYAKIMGHVAVEDNLNNVCSRFLERIADFYSLRRDYITANLDVFCDRP
jgi:hypothetical protein